MIKLFSDEWFLRFEENINTNQNYQNYAADWEGDVIFYIKGDAMSESIKLGLKKIAKLKLFHGKCLGIEFLETIKKEETGYILEGSASVWESVVNGKANIVSSILQGKIGVIGDMKKLMKYMAAAQELVRAAKETSIL